MRKFNNWNNNRSPQYRRTSFRPVGKFDPRIDNSEEILKSFTFRTVVADYGEDTERLLRRFKRVVEASGILSEIRKREHHKSCGQIRRERHLKSIKNVRKRQAKAERFADYDSKKPANRPYNQRRPEQNERDVVAVAAPE